MTIDPTPSSTGDVLLYTTEDGHTSIEVRVEAETVWLTQEQLVELFKRDQSVISRHISNAKREGELRSGSFMQNLHKTSAGRPETLYDLDVVVGYRVKSPEGAFPPLGGDSAV
jgi:hypothetical protein